ncbi:MAG: S-layer homology domain-containing protein [Clostridia bacterium]|nr:S-layer homology domain-containing protein [Clostridia bacterium]
MKKCIAILLALCMLFSGISVFAASKAAQQEFVNETFKDEIIVSVEDVERVGEWTKSSAIKNYDGGPNYYAKSDATVSFKPEKLKAGNYELYYWVPVHQNNVDKLEMSVLHNGKTSSTYVYPKPDTDEVLESGWVSLGVFDFAGTGDEYVLLEANKTNTRATAVKYVPTDKEALGKIETSTESEKEEETTHGDATLPMSVDNDPVGSCKYVGDWAFSGRVPGPMTKAPSSLWIESAGPETYVEYNPAILNGGQVRVSVFLLYWEKGHVNDVKYTVHHNGKVDEFHLDPTKLTKNEWITLGTFDFEGNSKDYVRLECTGGVGNTRASTLAFEIMNSAKENAVWQTLYVTPTQDNESLILSQEDILAKLNKFDDMKEHWAHYDVEYMANEGLVSGVSDNAFDPEAQITRAEYVTILDRAMKYEIVNGESYADISADAWYAPYVATAKANGLLNGLPTDDGFKPEQPITREEMALFTYNAIKQTGKNDEWLSDLPTDYAKFTDTASVSDWAAEALEYLIHTGIIKGTSDTTVSPKDNANRAQGAVILKRFMQLFVWAGPPTNDEWVLTFNDEFLGDSMDWKVWESGSYDSGSSNILSARGPDNAVVKDGALHMMTIKERKGKAGKEWTTAHLSVIPEVFRQKYGYWEARYKICDSSGINNAFWLITGAGTIMDYKQSFEIDINEGHYPNEVACTYHYKSTGEAKAHSKGHRAAYNLAQDYHT